MRRAITVLFALTLPLLILAPPMEAQSNPAHAHMGHVAEAFGNTPDGRGLLPTAMEEAEIAATHAEYAARDLDDLASMQRHTEHVLHALSPDEIDHGPGLGYGVLQAAEGVIVHIEMAAEADEATDNIRTHSVHVATSARNTVQRAEEGIQLAHQILALGSAGEAAPLVEELAELTAAIITGVDATGDGQISWGEGEGGLEQSQRHMELMLQGEGLGG